MSDYIVREHYGTNCVLRLNRPEKLNALSYEMIDEILELLEDIERNEDIRAVIFTGTGKKAFCAGADIPQFKKSILEGRVAAKRDFSARGQRLTRRVEEYSKPVIVAVNGLAYGGGCELLEAAHIGIAVDSATFAKPEIKRGIPPTFGGTQRLPRVAGKKRALYWLLTGESFDAHTAIQMGLINKVCSRDNLLDEAIRIGNTIARFTPESATAILSAVMKGLNTTVNDGLEIEQDEFARLVDIDVIDLELEKWVSREDKRGTEI